MEVAEDTAYRPTRDDYESAVVHIYDVADTAEDWLTIRSAKNYAGHQWLDVCFIVSKRLSAGDRLGVAFNVAMKELGICP